MTLRKWITFASAAGLIATLGACNDNKGGTSRTGSSATEPQGRSGAMPSRARSDAGATDNTTPTTPSSGTSGSASSPSSAPSSPSTTTGSPGTTPSSPSGSDSNQR